MPNRSARQIGNEQIISVLVEGQGGSHQRRRLQSIGGITRQWRHGYRTLRQQPDVTPYTADSVDEIDFVRHRLDTKYFFTVNRWRGCTVGSRSSYFPNPSLTGQSVTSPEVSLLIEGDADRSRNA